MRQQHNPILVLLRYADCQALGATIIATVGYTEKWPWFGNMAWAMQSIIVTRTCLNTCLWRKCVLVEPRCILSHQGGMNDFLHKDKMSTYTDNDTFCSDKTVTKSNIEKLPTNRILL